MKVIEELLMIKARQGRNVHIVLSGCGIQAIKSFAGDAGAMAQRWGV